MKACGQVSIPTVDNSALSCEEFTLSQCVIVEQICGKVGNLEGENLNQFIERLCAKFTKLDNQIIALNQKINNLKTRVTELENGSNDGPVVIGGGGDLPNDDMI